MAMDYLAQVIAQVWLAWPIMPVVGRIV